MVKNRNKESDEENNYVSLEGSTKNQKARTIELNIYLTENKIQSGQQSAR